MTPAPVSTDCGAPSRDRCKQWGAGKFFRDCAPAGRLSWLRAQGKLIEPPSPCLPEREKS